MKNIEEAMDEFLGQYKGGIGETLFDIQAIGSMVLICGEMFDSKIRSEIAAFLIEKTEELRKRKFEEISSN